MRKIIFLLSLLASLAAAPAICAENTDTKNTAEAPAEKVYYIEIEGLQRGISQNMQVRVLTGRLLPASIGLRDNETALASRNLNFPSLIDALNYFGQRGWVCQTSFITQQGGNTTSHIVMSRTTTDPIAIVNDLLGNTHK